MDTIYLLTTIMWATCTCTNWEINIRAMEAQKSQHSALESIKRILSRYIKKLISSEYSRYIIRHYHLAHPFSSRSLLASIFFSALTLNKKETANISIIIFWYVWLIVTIWIIYSNAADWHSTSIRGKSTKKRTNNKGYVAVSILSCDAAWICIYIFILCIYIWRGFDVRQSHKNH